MLSTIKHIHFVGIGGMGMSGLAEIALDQGFSVSGSDLSESDITRHLAQSGAAIHIGHSAAHIDGADVVVYSSAVKITDNPETAEAEKRKIPLIRRAEMLAEVTRLKYSVSIAGTHGKTTTTSMTGLALMNGGLDPTVIVGGKLSGLGGTNARLGKGEWAVVEADEFDRSFLKLTPTVAVITNLEREHMDIYKDIDDLKSAFVEFANKVPFYGFVVLCIDDPGVMDIFPSIRRKKVTYGLSPQADYRAVDPVYEGEGSSSVVVNNKTGETLGTLRLNVPGQHNIQNALAAIAAGCELGVPFERLAQALHTFSGVYRRFEVKGSIDDVMVVDDYAHHPTEVAATLSAARKGWKRRVIGVFQPHTYTRTKEFYKEFGRAFFDADVLIVLDVYPAREIPIEGVTGKLIADAAADYGHKNVLWCPSLQDALHTLSSTTKPGDLVVTMGAGDVWKVGRDFLAAE